jgi:hypothetical protein
VNHSETAQFPTENTACSRRRRGGGVEPILSEACSQGYPKSAICVQKLDDSLNSAIRITYRISLRSSSVREPRYPLLRVVQRFVCCFETISPVRAPERQTQNVVFKLLFSSGDRKDLVLVGLSIGNLKENKKIGREKKHTKGFSVRRLFCLRAHEGVYVGYVLMILPQVHLRKPCYDFYFL